MKKLLLSVATLAAVAAVSTAEAHSACASEPEIPVICMVNGERITDPGQIAYHTREALILASDNLRLPGVILSNTLTPALTKVCEILNELINNS